MGLHVTGHSREYPRGGGDTWHGPVRWGWNDSRTPTLKTGHTGLSSGGGGVSRTPKIWGEGGVGKRAQLKGTINQLL